MDAQFYQRIEQALRAAPGSIQVTDRLTDLEGWDSIGALSVIAVVDQHYNVTIDANALFNCETIADLAAIVDGGLKAA